MRRRRALSAALALALASSGCAIPRWPAEGPMTSAFGVRWRGLLPEVHRGVDIGVPTGTPVHAMAGGRVRFAGVQGGFGNAVWVDHGGGVLSLYAHLSRLDVATGQAISSGQRLGLSGATGNVSGPHLHFEVWRWGRPVDPVPLLGGPPAGVSPAP
ncbi:MAG: M23 family metallopeptidase [Longimicrobiales bacterium]|nr:M23 family metallopeptidase [Longimicrobiales bacterium]